MAKVYIEPKPKGRPEGSPIEEYAVEESGGQVLETQRTQAEAVGWAKAKGHEPIMIARVRNTDKGNPDHWRAV